MDSRRGLGKHGGDNKVQSLDKCLSANYVPGTDLGPREKAVNTKLCSQATDKQLRADRQRISKYMRSRGQTCCEEKRSRVKVGIEQGLCGGHSEKASLRGRHHCRLEKSTAPGGCVLMRRGNVESERPGGDSIADVLGRKYEWSPMCRRVEKMIREEVGGGDMQSLPGSPRDYDWKPR